jgi:predicted phosphodiesterase
MEKEIWVLGDLHIAEHWDKTEKILKEKKADIGLLNPNKELVNIIKKINASQKIAGVVFNGDLVDYFFKEYTKKEKRKSNWDLFNSIISKLKKPLFMVPGNHDYRKEPYNYNLYINGMKHVNLPDSIRKKFRKEIGFHSFRWLGELNAITVNEKKFNPLQKYLGIKNPQKKEIGPYQCIFLNTGSDAYVRKRNLMKFLLKFLLTFSVRTDVDGLNGKDIEFVKKAIRSGKKTFYIFMHGPIINSEGKSKDYKLSTRNFFFNIAKHGLARHVLVNNGGKLLDVLRKSSKNIIIISSHAHHSKYFLINKNNLSAKESTINEINRFIDNPDYIKQIITLPLGAIDPCFRKTGYLKINPNKIKEVVIKKL